MERKSLALVAKDPPLATKPSHLPIHSMVTKFARRMEGANHLSGEHCAVTGSMQTFRNILNCSLTLSYELRELLWCLFLAERKHFRPLRSRLCPLTAIV